MRCTMKRASGEPLLRCQLAGPGQWKRAGRLPGGWITGRAFATIWHDLARFARIKLPGGGARSADDRPGRAARFSRPGRAPAWSIIVRSFIYPFSPNLTETGWTKAVQGCNKGEILFLPVSERSE